MPSQGCVLTNVRSPAAGGLNLELLRAVWTLVIGFCFNSMYVYTDGCINNTHPIRRSVYTAFVWLLIHLPMSAGLLIGGHVSAGSTFEQELGSGKRCLWGGGLGLGMFCMWIIAQLYREDDDPGQLILGKQLRLLPRLLVSLIYVLLPLASNESLSSTALISTGAGISAFVVIWEMLTGLEKGAGAFESWKGRAEDFDTVIDIGSRRKVVQAENPKLENGNEKAVLEE